MQNSRMSAKSQFQFSDPKLFSSQFEVNLDFDWKYTDDTPEKTPMRIGICRPEADECKENEAVVGLKVEIGERSENCPYYLSVFMCSKFEWEPDMEFVEELLQYKAPSLLLGYIRPFVAQMTACSPFGIINIPFVNLASENPEEVVRRQLPTA